MSNLAFLEYIHRINNATGPGALETVAEELRRADILPGMHSNVANDELTENMRNEWRLGLFLLIMDRRAYDRITPWLSESITMLTGEDGEKS